jgi:hypothetical protein
MCQNNNPDCNHLFQGNGAVNTIVRLPESVCCFCFQPFRSSICQPHSLSGLSVWPDAICARGSTPDSSIQLGYSRQWLGGPRPPIDARHQLCGGWPVTVRVVSSQDRSSLHRPPFCNRGGDVNFSVQGQNSQDGSNPVNRRNHRRSRPLGSFDFVLSVSLHETMR